MQEQFQQQIRNLQQQLHDIQQKFYQILLREPTACDRLRNQRIL